MTFLVNHSGVVFQKDLGPETAALAQKMTSFNPDQTWKKADTTTAAQFGPAASRSGLTP